MFLKFDSVWTHARRCQDGEIRETTEIRHISYINPRCCDPLISINGLLSAPPDKERLLYTSYKATRSLGTRRDGRMAVRMRKIWP